MSFSLVSSLPWLGALCAAALAIGTLLRARGTIADRSFAAGMLAIAVEGICTGLSCRSGVMIEDMVRWQKWRLAAASLLPGLWLLFSLTYARGNARMFIARWWPVLVLSWAVPLACVGFFWHRLIVALSPVAGSVRWTFGLGPAGLVDCLVLLVTSILIVTNFERTFRAAVGTMRWRIKFMLTGAVLLATFWIYSMTQVLLFHGIGLFLEEVEGSVVMLASALMVRSFLRSGGIDLGVYPSLSVLRGSFTLLLAGVYLLIVGLVARLVVHLGGGHVLSLEALLVLVSLVALVILLQSNRLRTQLGLLISRHFQRPVYDYHTVWRRFTDGTASQASRPELCRSLVNLVADVCQSLSVAIWTVAGQQDVLELAASTSLSESQGRKLVPSKAQASAVVAYFRSHPGLIDLGTSRDPVVATLREMHPSQFREQENRVCLPLIARGEILGLMFLGDRVSGVPFSAQDFDMLNCMGNHVAASLLNLELGVRLLQAKELEAFQTMATFFVHDLKNAASTLGMMLKNLPIHFDDPAFREDALRGVGKTVNHINHVISRLGLLRQEMKLQPAETDVNQILTDAVAGLETDNGLAIERELTLDSKVMLDSDQITKVVTNLVLNAREAMAGQGRLRVATAAENGWAVITVADSGCGMSPDFLARSLFRPFQTTKKNGLGIGMFQSKMIVDVHGGHLTVASDVGKGTTFQVFLPFKQKT